MKKSTVNRNAVCIFISAWFLSGVEGHAQSLQALYDIADRESHQIQVSQAGLLAASEAVEQAKTAMMPTVSLGLSGSYIGTATLMSRGFSTSGTTDVIVAGLGPQAVANGAQETPHWGNTFSAQASQVIYAGGGIQAGIRMAQLGKELAELDVEQNRQEVRFLIAGYYLDLYKLQNQREVIDKNIDLTQQVIKAMEARREQGTVLQNDLTRYELQLKTLELTRGKLDDAAAIINRQLVTTLHLPDSTQVQPDRRLLDEEYASLQTLADEQVWQQQGAESNLGIRQATVARDLAGEKVKATQAASRPSLALVVEDNLFGPYTSDLIPVNANVNTWFVGIGVKYSLSSLWQNKHNIRQARHESHQAQERVSLAAEGVSNGIQACYVNLLTAFREVETQEKQVELSDQNFSVVENRYRNDLALLTDMLDASNTKLTADMALTDARIQLLYNYYRLRFATSTL